MHIDDTKIYEEKLLMTIEKESEESRKKRLFGMYNELTTCVQMIGLYPHSARHREHLLPRIIKKIEKEIGD